MGGTIRCVHGYVYGIAAITETGVKLETSPHEHNTIWQTPHHVACVLYLSKDTFDGIQQGGNFTHMFFDDKKDMMNHLADTDKYRFIGSVNAKMLDGRYHVVF